MKPVCREQGGPDVIVALPKEIKQLDGGLACCGVLKNQTRADSRHGAPGRGRVCFAGEKASRICKLLGRNHAETGLVGLALQLESSCCYGPGVG